MNIVYICAIYRKIFRMKLLALHILSIHNIYHNAILFRIVDIYIIYIYTFLYIRINWVLLSLSGYILTALDFGRTAE